MQKKEIKTKDDISVSTAGVVYGNVVSVFVLTGVIVACIGVIWSIAGGTSVIAPETFLKQLWNGRSPEAIWQASTLDKAPDNHWYLGHLTTADGFAMAGVSICCFGAVIGMWSAFITYIISAYERARRMSLLYLVVAFLLSVILTLSALGIIK